MPGTGKKIPADIYSQNTDLNETGTMASAARTGYTLYTHTHTQSLNVQTNARI